MYFRHGDCGLFFPRVRLILSQLLQVIELLRVASGPHKPQPILRAGRAPPDTTALRRSDPRAPCSSPCSDGETRWVMSDCDGGVASAQSAFTGIATRKAQPAGAHPNMAKPSAPKNMPANNARRSPKRLTTGPTRSAEVSMEAMPTTASDVPMALASHE